MIQEINPKTLQHEVTLPQSKGLLLTLPPGAKGKLLTPARLQTEVRTKQTVEVEDVGALEAYLQSQVVNPATLALFIDTRARTVLAVLDHAATHEKPGFNEHSAKLKLEFSPEFAPLHRALNNAMSQGDFLDFIDRNAHIFIEAAALKEVCANFHSVTIVRVKSVRNLTNGTGKFVYDSDEQQDAEMRTPPAVITTKLAIFPDQQPLELEVMIRYRAPGGKLEFTLLVPGLDAIVRSEVAKIENRLSTFLETRHKATNIPTWKTVPIVRGVPKLTPPLDAQVIDINGADLPTTLSLGSKEAAE
jgi:hypothetical protein